MKPKTVFTVIFSFIVFTLVGQTIEETYQFAGKQFEAGNYHSALTEFQRVAFFDSKNQYDEVYGKIGDSFFATGNFSGAIRNYNIASRVAKNDSVKTEIILKKALSYFRQNDFFYALTELLAVPASQNFYLQNKINLYSAIALFGIEDYQQAFLNLQNIVAEEDIASLEEIFNRFEKIRTRFRPGKIETMSIIFPGLGQMYCGNITSGINSVILVGGIAVIAIWAWQTYGVLDALLSVSSWYYRYYTGGVQNARATAMEKISLEKEKAFNQIIQLVENNLNQNP